MVVAVVVVAAQLEIQEVLVEVLLEAQIQQPLGLLHKVMLAVQIAMVVGLEVVVAVQEQLGEALQALVPRLLLVMAEMECHRQLLVPQ